MATGVVRGSTKHQTRSRAPVNQSQRCFLCIIGVLGGFMALLQGMIAAQTMTFATPEGFATYWVVAVLGIWVPAVGIVASIVGVVIRERIAMLLLLLSPIASIGGYFFYTYGPVAELFRP